MSIDGRQMTLEVAGLGIVFHSPHATQHLQVGADFLTSHYVNEEQVQRYIQSGTIVGFATGSPGTFLLIFHSGYPDDALLNACEFKLRLGLHCRGGVVCFRDLYDLLDWRPDCNPEHLLDLEEGYYHVTLCSNRPASGLIGDRQEIHVYLQRLNVLPKLTARGVPTLCR
jgi:hypothetical protein